MEYKLYDHELLANFFNDNFIEDDELFECLKDRELILIMDSKKDAKRGETELLIKVKLTEQ